MAAVRKVPVVAIERHAGTLMIPNSMTYAQAIEVLRRIMEYDEEIVDISEIIPAFVWDGALALEKALKEIHGMAHQLMVHGPDGPEPPAQIQVPVSPSGTIPVSWGRFMLPGIDGFVETGVQKAPSGRYEFRVMGQVRHKNEETVRKLIQRTREIAALESIYRGKAINVEFTNDEGKAIPLPMPKFIQLMDQPPIFNRELQDEIEDLVFTPLRYMKEAEDWNVKFKRGFLFGGEYGVGKTMLAQMIAKVAVENGVGYINGTKGHELPFLLEFASQQQPCVLLVEDVDRFAGLERTDEVNRVLNTLDGVGNKGDRIMVVFTSNFPDRINPAMLRGGRIDRTIHIPRPDADAAARLVHYYAGDRLKKGENLDAVGRALANQVPANIREVVEASKLSAIRRSEGKGLTIVAEDLMRAARALAREREMFAPVLPEPHPVDRLGTALGRGMADGLGAHLQTLLPLAMNGKDD
jgi:SpoVK/Ycf46/Vps4 family AAA+-type ATPase